MSFWQFIDGLIRQPPFYIVAIIVAILVAHALKMAFEFVTKRKQSSSLIITLELIVVIVLGYLSIHQYVEKFMIGSEHTSPHSDPLWMVVSLIFFTLISMVIYIFYRAAIRDKD